MGTELEDAINKAQEDNPIVSEPVIEEDEEKVEAEPEEKPEGKVEDRTAKAIEFYEMMQDPSKSQAYIADLVAKAGYVKPTNKAEASEQVKGFKDYLVEELPDEFKFVAESMAAGLEKAVNASIKAATSRIEANVGNQEAMLVTKEIDSTVSRLESELPDFKSLDSKMAEIAKELPPSNNIPLEKYMRHLYKLAGGKGKDATIKNEKINKNRADSRPGSDGAKPASVTEPSGMLSLDEAISKSLKEHNVA